MYFTTNLMPRNYEIHPSHSVKVMPQNDICLCYRQFGVALIDRPNQFEIFYTYFQQASLHKSKS